ncbi:hypothetical protein V5799_019188 [Amblyomma americanum]|uniref:Uncharacterized protein n=1 Tax=Amblyomma americanum TaxID=6943 RepID=A0AAQ4EXL5_AMBAM
MARLMASLERRLLGPPGRGPRSPVAGSAGAPPAALLSSSKEGQTGASGTVAPAGTPMEAPSPNSMGTVWHARTLIGWRR